ncbi:MAG: helix-hairpin-helix domain-containing protein, partial [Anaerolineae bacterium]
FTVGILLGVLVGLIIWYWQKSTSAEDGALDLLDRLADAGARWRGARQPAALRQSSLIPPDDLETVKGIGPVFAQRLAAAGIQRIAQLAATDAGTLAGILKVRQGRTVAILAEARQMAG